MYISDERIDKGKLFDWGRASSDYAKYRDIYPQEFYSRLVDLGVCIKGQNVLDVGTGTGVLPRNMYKYGAKFIGSDISENQIAQAKILASENNQNIEFIVSPTEEINFDDNTFDVITACQCFFYFKHDKVIPEFARMLKKGGKLAILYMSWLPFEDEVANASEQLVLKYNPQWSGAGETMHPIDMPQCASKYFYVVHSEEYKIDVPFTRESWHGRMRACRGVGASLSDEDIKSWEKEHKNFLSENAEETFTVKHYVAMKILQVKK